ncbi:MAG: class I SAM-dependent methyltransferase [Deltaproteobacteria bacterium]|nr:class I SAM-dependent methyltransferase [Deltaproteobacteria bacterium]
MNPEWFSTFFQGAFWEASRNSITPEMTEAEADFLHAALSPSPGAALLDVPCGDGRLALAMAARGFAVTGVDRSELLMARGRKQADSAGLSIAWQSQDMRAMELPCAFQGAWCMGNSFAYFDRQGTQDFLSRVSKALMPGARFVLDTHMAAETVLLELSDRTWKQVGDLLVLVEQDYLVDAGRLDTTYTVVRGGRRQTRQVSHWIYTVAEIRHFLEDAGLHLLSLFSGLDQEPFAPGNPRLILVAEKAKRIQKSSSHTRPK